MDRNWQDIDERETISAVALRKESVDRNPERRAVQRVLRVALRKESVDRNMGVGTTRARRGVSLSARRAWIEIDFAGSDWVSDFPSLSARRAWIEIACPLGPQAIYPSRSPQGERG